MNALVEADPEAAAVATNALGTTLRFRALPTAAATADVVRSRTGLRVKLFVPAETPRIVQGMAAVRVAGALRALDPDAPRIDISCAVNAST